MLVTNLFFDPAGEDLDGKGWTVASWVETTGGPDGPPAVITTVKYLTLTAAQAAIKALFIADTDVLAYFTAKAQATVLAANAAAVASALSASKTAEGLV